MSAPGTAPVLEISDLHVTFPGTPPARAVRGVSLRIGAGEIVGLVGESGSGKTVLASSVLGLLPRRPAPHVRGTVAVGGTDMLRAGERDRRRVRRLDLGAVFQDPMASLDPTMRIGSQVSHVAGSRDEAVRLLTAAGVADAAARLDSYPHQLSGGQRQRVTIAAAIAGSPALLVADEPTTALDVTVQAQILRLLRQLRDGFGCSVLLVTHNLDVAGEVADRLVVMYGGRLAELGPTPDVIGRPRHAYTAALLGSRLELTTDRTHRLPTVPGEPPLPTDPPPGCAFAPRCRLVTDDCEREPPALRDLGGDPGGDLGDDPGGESAGGPGDRASACLHAGEVTVGIADADFAPRQPAGPAVAAGPVLTMRRVGKSFALGRRRRGGRLDALSGIDLDVDAGEAVALVGESGSGKTTLLRIAAGLLAADSGTVATAPGDRPQVVHQDATGSLTPWLTVGRLLSERLVGSGTPASRRSGAVAEALARVGLRPRVAGLRPAALSGGQRQRVVLARAIIVPPRLLLCDEPTSALDVSLAATVLNLLCDLRRELGMALLVVTHDLAAARFVADRIVVLRDGRVVESGDAESVVTAPRDPYTQALLAAVPRRHA